MLEGIGAVLAGALLGGAYALHLAGFRFQRRVERAVRVQERRVYRPGPIGEVVYADGEVYVSNGQNWIDCPNAAVAVALAEDLKAAHGRN